MRVRKIKKSFDTIKDLPFTNLFVSGCSFTYNNSNEDSCTWPYYLANFSNIKNVYDSSLPGAGNYHIIFSLIWTLENIEHNIDDSLVVVMFSGNNRDDCIADCDSIQEWGAKFSYSKDVVAGVGGGVGPGLEPAGNRSCLCVSKEKSYQSRSIENFLYKITIYNYLQNKGYKFLLLDYMKPGTPARDQNFDISRYLNLSNNNKIEQLHDCTKEDLYKFSVKNNYLESDDFHPTANGHFEWTKQFLLPAILQKYF